VQLIFASLAGQHTSYCEVRKQSWWPLWWDSCFWYFWNRDFKGTESICRGTHLFLSCSLFLMMSYRIFLYLWS